MDDFDTQITPEETQEYQNYLDANEEKAKPKEVWLAFGSPDQTGPIVYTFNTEAEVKAFLLGVDECCGWTDYKLFESKEEVDAYVNKDPEC